MSALVGRLVTETPVGGNGMSLITTQLMALHRQLFRAVFQREREQHDPVHWDPQRESEGPVPVDRAQKRQNLRRILPNPNICPEAAYAMTLTGMAPTLADSHLYSDADLREWQDAVVEYLHQAQTGVLPLIPEDMFLARETVQGVHADGVAIGDDDPKATELRMVAKLEEALGSKDMALAAMMRMSALLKLREEAEFTHIVSPYTDAMLIAAASAEIDRSTWGFNLDSFRDLLFVAEHESEFECD